MKSDKKNLIFFPKVRLFPFSTAAAANDAKRPLVKYFIEKKTVFENLMRLFSQISQKGPDLDFPEFELDISIFLQLIKATKTSRKFVKLISYKPFFVWP